MGLRLNRMLTQQTTIKAQGALHDMRPGKRLRPTTGSMTHCLLQGRGCEQPQDGLGKSLYIPNWSEEARLSMHHG
jgi:hypothetical protein